jgi:hypothetical protein
MFHTDLTYISTYIAAKKVYILSYEAMKVRCDISGGMCSVAA